MSEATLHHPTDDVQAAFEFLKVSGWSVVSTRGGPGESFGNQTVGLSDGSSSVHLTRDRGQWALVAKPAGWDRTCSLQQLLTSMRLHHLPNAVHHEPMPAQLPLGEVWVKRLPEALDWALGPPHRSVFVDIECERYRSHHAGGDPAAPELALVESWVRKLATVIDAPDSYLPTFGSSEDGPRPHVEIVGRQLSFVVAERGQEPERVTFTEAIDFLGHVFLSVTFTMAVDWAARHQKDDEGFRRYALAKQFVLLDQLHPLWAKVWADHYDARFRTVQLNRNAAHALIDQAEARLR